MSKEIDQIKEERFLIEMRALLQDLKNEDWQIRLRSIPALVSLKKTEEYYSEVLPAIINQLDDEEKIVSEACISALGDIGARARVAVPKLNELIKTSNKESTKIIVYSLGKIGPDAAPALNSLVELLDNDDLDLQKSVAWAIGIMGPVSLPFISKVLEEGTNRSISGALQAIGIMGVSAISILDATISQLTSQDIIVKSEACKAIGNMRASSESERAVSHLKNLLDDNDPDVRWLASEALRKIGSEESMKAWAQYKPIETIASISKQLDNDDKAVRENSAQALFAALKKHSDFDPDPIKEIMMKRSNHPKLLVLIAEAISNLEEKGLVFESDLIALLNHEEQNVRAQTVLTLGKISPTKESTISSVAKLLTDKVKEVRMNAALSLELIGGASAEKFLAKFDWQ